MMHCECVKYSHNINDHSAIILLPELGVQLPHPALQHGRKKGGVCRDIYFAFIPSREGPQNALLRC